MDPAASTSFLILALLFSVIFFLNIIVILLSVTHAIYESIQNYIKKIQNYIKKIYFLTANWPYYIGMNTLCQVKINSNLSNMHIRFCQTRPICRRWRLSSVLNVRKIKKRWCFNFSSFKGRICEPYTRSCLNKQNDTFVLTLIFYLAVNSARFFAYSRTVKILARRSVSYVLIFWVFQLILLFRRVIFH